MAVPEEQRGPGRVHGRPRAGGGAGGSLACAGSGDRMSGGGEAPGPCRFCGRSRDAGPRRSPAPGWFPCRSTRPGAASLPWCRRAPSATQLVVLDGDRCAAGGDTGRETRRRQPGIGTAGRHRHCRVAPNSPVARRRHPPSSRCWTNGSCSRRPHWSAWVRPRTKRVPYAAERRAFGGVIGGYQGVAHPWLRMPPASTGRACGPEGGAGRSTPAARAGRELAALAFAFAVRDGRTVTYQAIHFHGGYGFMLEHDVQLFYRRARGWARVWGSADDAYRRAARRARYGTSHLRSA